MNKITNEKIASLKPKPRKGIEHNLGEIIEVPQDEGEDAYI